MQANGLGPKQYGTAIAMNGLLIILVTIPVSNMAANWPRFETIAVATILLGLGFGYTALASTLPFYMLSVAIWTIGEIAGTAVGPAIIADLSPPDSRGLYQGVFGSAWGLSFFFGPLAGGWVYQHLGKNALWFGCLLLGIVIALGFLLLSRKAKRYELIAQNQ
jgi:MFS family permease